MYDVDGDGYISVSDFSTCLQMMVGENIDPAAVKRIAADAIRAADEDKDGQLNMAEFEKRLEGTDIDNLLKVSVP